MPPKKTSELPLTKAEITLLDTAARIFTGIAYKETHPEMDDMELFGSVDLEMVRHINHFTLSFNSDFLQMHIRDLYSIYPIEPGKPHCNHGAVVAVSMEYQSSVDEDRDPNYTAITTDKIKQCIASIAKKYPSWPAVLKSTDLSDVVAAQDDKVKWWLNLPLSSPEEDPGACKYIGVLLRFNDYNFTQYLWATAF